MTEEEAVEEEMEGRGARGGLLLPVCPLAILARVLLKREEGLITAIPSLLSLLRDSHIGAPLHARPHQPHRAFADQLAITVPIPWLGLLRPRLEGYCSVFM